MLNRIAQRLRRERRQRRGQAAVLAAAIFFTLVIFAAMSTNLGIVVNDKIRMQNTADLATYTVAMREAEVLNELTLVNRQILNLVGQCRDQLMAGTPWPDCLCQERSPAADAIIQACQSALDPLILSFVQLAEYNSSVAPALEDGRSAAEANFEGTGNYAYFMEQEAGSPTFEGTYYVNYDTNISGGGSYPAIANYENVTVTLNYMHMTFCVYCTVPLIFFPETAVAAWFYKTNDDPEIWVAGRVKGTPKKRFLDIDYGSYPDGGFFGSSSTGGDDTLWAYSVAKPFEGSVGPSHSSIPGTDRTGEWTFGPIYVSHTTFGKDYDALGFMDEYRARLVGMNEEVSGISPPSLAYLDGINEGKLWNVSYFKH
jgi:hypothetical protein